MKQKRKKRGFEGQKMIVLPPSVVEEVRKNDPFGELFVTHIGVFPKAEYHYRERPEGTTEYVLIYCVDGEGWYETKGEQYGVQANEVLILPAETPHRYGASPHNPWSIYWIHFAGRQAGAMSELFRKGRAGFHGKMSSAGNRMHLFGEIYRSLEKGYTAENLGYANSCLWHFLGTFCFPEECGQHRASGEHDPIAATIRYMEDHLHRQLKVEDLARQAYYSVSHYSTLFREKTGYAPGEYLIHLKIRKACQYLDLTHLKIKEIAEKTGFSDPHYFSRLFKKVMGTSPNQYRKKQKG